MSCSKVEGECKGDVPQRTFPESSSIASRCVPNLAPAPKAEDLGLASRPPSQNACGGLSVCCLCSALGVVVAKDCLSNCYCPMGPRNTSPPGHQSRAIKGYPWEAAAKTRALNVKTGAPDSYKSSHPPKSQGRFTVSPKMWT